MRYSLLFTMLPVYFIANVANAQALFVPKSIPASVEKANNVATPAPSRLPVARDGEIIDSVGSGAIDAVLTVEQTENGISYITGGIGDEELAELNAQEKNYNTRILLKATNGEFMGDVALRVLDKKNNVILSVDAAGPYFFTNLPAGSYIVEAKSSKGTVKTAKITPSSKPSVGKVHIIFNE